MITRSQAIKAKDKLKNILHGKSWVRGIGMTLDGDIAIGGEWAIKVNVNKLTDEVGEDIPDIVDGVKVVVEEVGEIRALWG